MTLRVNPILVGQQQIRLSQEGPASVCRLAHEDKSRSQTSAAEQHSPGALGATALDRSWVILSHSEKTKHEDCGEHEQYDSCPPSRAIPSADHHHAHMSEPIQGHCDGEDPDERCRKFSITDREQERNKTECIDNRIDTHKQRERHVAQRESLPDPRSYLLYQVQDQRHDKQEYDARCATHGGPRPS